MNKKCMLIWLGIVLLVLLFSSCNDNISVGLDYKEIVEVKSDVSFVEAGLDKSGNKYIIYKLGSRENVILTEVENPVYYNVKGIELSYSITEVTKESIEEYLQTSVTAYEEVSVGVSAGISGLLELYGEAKVGLQETIATGYNRLFETASSTRNTAKVSLDKCELGKYYAWAITGCEDVYQCFKFDKNGNLVKNEIFSNIKSCEQRIIASDNSSYEYSSENKLSTLDPSIAEKRLKVELGEGTLENPYKINSANALFNIRNDMTANYKLTSDIDLSEFGEWEPIGGCYGNAVFTGTLDGTKNGTKNYKITGLTRTNDIQELQNRIYFGLFGWISSSACISNIDFVDVNISFKGPANNNASVCVFLGVVSGAISGGAEIKNVTTNGKICFDCCTNGGAFVGGIVGNATSKDFSNNENETDFIINNCINNCDVIASRYAAYAGGIAGYSTSGNIKDCVNNGTITSRGTAWWGYSYVGGIIGMMSSSQQTLCENTANNGKLKAEYYPMGPCCYLGTGDIYGSLNDLHQ